MDSDKYWIIELNVYGDQATVEKIEEDIYEGLWSKYCECGEDFSQVCNSPIVGMARYPDKEMNKIVEKGDLE